MAENTWKPLEKEKIEKIRENFISAYPEAEYGDLAEQISVYWIDLLRKIWEDKEVAVKQKDLTYDPSDPLSRIEQKTMAITYADSMKDGTGPTLKALVRFVGEYFPALRGFHLLPACSVSEERFNDGYFSQIDRSRIHEAFGTNEEFAEIMKNYFSMNDFILNHVDIDNPGFQRYLAGDDEAGLAFFIFTEEEYQKLEKAGSFTSVFRPRPFPLFTLFRRLPRDPRRRNQPIAERLKEMGEIIAKKTGILLAPETVGILLIFNKIKNDQMLLEEDVEYISAFIRSIPELPKKGLTRESFFTLSAAQEVQHEPFIFIDEISRPSDFLIRAGMGADDAGRKEEVFKEHEEELFGEEVRVLTTFSHVQADINLTTFQGLKLLADDLSFYLSMDLNLLRFDAVNYGFKKWGTSCFGLPEINNIMKIIYLSMECVSPRMVPNLEVNDSLTTILTQMSRKDSPPPMMHDFHLVSMVPSMFHLERPEIARRIRPLIEQFDIPQTSIRFSLSESHDGKSVRGSMDLLTVQERQYLAGAVEKNGGKIKYKAVLPGVLPKDEFRRFCGETGLDYAEAAGHLFLSKEEEEGLLRLRPELTVPEKLLRAHPPLAAPEIADSVKYLITKLIEGREPYELCTSTRDSLPFPGNRELEIKRYLAFHTLAFALMGRNVKTVYFNDLMGLPNDLEKLRATGELRNIKRTKSEYGEIKTRLNDPTSFESAAAVGMNNLLALVDSDAGLHYRGGEARVLRAFLFTPGESPELGGPAAPEVPVCAVYNHWGDHHTLTVVNLSGTTASARISLRDTPAARLHSLYENFSERIVEMEQPGVFTAKIAPFERLWCTSEKIDIAPELLR